MSDSTAAKKGREAKQAEVFLLPNGCLYHLGVKSGELNPRILTVGTYRGTPVSVVSIGMVFCLCAKVMLNSLCDHKALLNYGFYDGDPLASEGMKHPNTPYLIAGPVEGDKELIDRLQANVEKQQLQSCRGAGASAETFYACQGRHFPGFGDDNAQVLENFRKLNVESCEMESHQLYHLCQQRATKGAAVTRAASICLGVVNRVDPHSSSNRCAPDVTRKILVGAAQAALEALRNTPV
ncbi:hypothetical protein Emed_000230 [Eimeria media]